MSAYHCTRCAHHGEPCPQHQPTADRIENTHLGIYEPDDDAREPFRDENYTREFGAMLTAGGW